MFRLNNFKIVAKVSLIVALMAAVGVGIAIFSTHKMRLADDANTDVVTRVDKAVVTAVRAARIAENYLSSAFQLAAETTDAGNTKFLAQTTASENAYSATIAAVLKDLPERAEAIQPTIANFQKAFAACAPVIKYAATTTTPEENLKAAARLKAECVPLTEAAIAAHAKMVDGLLTESQKISDKLTEQADLAILMVWAFAAAGLCAGLVVALWIGITGLTRPIGRLKVTMEAFARNDFRADVPGVERRDELGEMARAVEVFKTSGLEVERLKEEQQAAAARAEQQRKADMTRLADDFEAATGEIIEIVSSASTELEASASTLASTAERAQDLTTTVSEASENASANVQSVASATEELSASVGEISRQVQASARMASDAVDQARITNERVGELSKAASRIGDVVELINTIAGQTNLLALNATIEAARAGEAGRGFAVVASEVKALAEQTAKATGEIGDQISAIQAATQQSVGAIKEISGTIERLSEISGTIASAIEEQGAATQEISRNIQLAAQGTHQVSSSIAHVKQGAGDTGAASSQVLSAAQSLAGESNRLKLEVGKFMNSVRAA